MKYLITISYDGSAYAGFQFQKNAETVQGKLTGAAGKLFSMPVSVTGCSRTDAGVHARGFCATLSSADGESLTVPPEKVPAGMNFYLPEDIAVTDCVCVPDSFHPRYSVVSKTYEYLIVNSRYRNPLMRGRAYMPGFILSDEDIRRMNEAAALLVGKKDFSSYMSAGSSVTDTVRTVMSCSVCERDGLCVISITADGFLYNMVRIIAGTLLAVGRSRITPSDILSVTESRDRHMAGETLPPEGLYLCRVDYGSAARAEGEG